MSVRFSYENSPGEEDDDDAYGEDDFEQEDDHLARSQKSPIKNPGTPKLSLSAAIQKELAAMGMEGAKPSQPPPPSVRNGSVSSSSDKSPIQQSKKPGIDDDDYNKLLDEGELDLEKYMSSMGFGSSNEPNEKNSATCPAIAQPLDGVQPSENDSDQKRIREKLGYALHTAQAISASLDGKRNSIESSQSPAGQSSYGRPIDVEDDEGETENPVDEATKVDNLLMELFPERYATNNGKKKSKEKTKKEKAKAPPAQYGLAAAPPRFVKEDREDEENDTQPKDVLSTLDSQLKLLKKDLKLKDDKIARLTDHSTMLANQLDRYKGEVARLNAKLHEAAMELEAKDSRLAEALKAKKKASKKVAQPVSPSQERTAGLLEGEICRLRDREQALLDAVEELSAQNEDLIVKLRESMERELELSSKRAALVNHAIVRGESHTLPSIHEKDPGSGSQSHRSIGSDHGQRGEQMRSQSEPSIDIPPKRGSKKKKKTTSAF